ncbi:hypothetical protein JOD82_001903 [Paenibacillus sp. 1182]|uniref:hypothetical protein n=1 Tax=Paenibacillus sp. 1182 TaxID=2806565 RepID=UPI001AE2CE3A|nr:hypothetical protein [Paenibacillus sp. 1182]MBP1308883.1 hypothetical protein [Paenibacillus sp. 1182]
MVQFPEKCPACGGSFEQVHDTHNQCDTCELAMLNGVYVLENEHDRGYHEVRIINNKICDPEKIPVSDGEVVSFLDRWLVNAGALKYDASAIELVSKLIPHFSYEGSLFRGFYHPFVIIRRQQTVHCIESWSKSRFGIQNLENYAQIAFGNVNKEDGSVETYTPEQFIESNIELQKEPFDRVIEEGFEGLDIVRLAHYVNYRPDFLQLLEDVEEVLVIQKC